MVFLILFLVIFFNILRQETGENTLKNNQREFNKTTHHLARVISF